MKLSKFKFNLNDLLIGLIIISPIIFLGYKVYNPNEAKLIEEDLAKRDSINIIARSLEPYEKVNKIYPECEENDWLNCFAKLEVLDFTPAYSDEISYKHSEDNLEMILYSPVRSLEWKQYCHTGTAYMLFSSVENKTEIVCTDSPNPGNQKFVN